MRTIKEIQKQYCPKGVISLAENETICKQYAKEAINEVLKQYRIHINNVIRSGGKSKSVDEISIEVMKNLK